MKTPPPKKTGHLNKPAIKIRFGLKVKLLGVFLAVAVFLVLAFSQGTIELARDSLAREISQNIESSARMSISKIDEWMTQNQADVLKMTDPYSSITDSLIEYRAQPTHENKTKVENELKRAMFNSANLIELYVMDNLTGEILVSTTPGYEGRIEVENEEEEYEPQFNLETSPIIFSERSNSYIIDIEGPIKNHLGQPIAALGAHINVLALSTFLFEHAPIMNEGDTGEAYLVTPEGQPIIGSWHTYFEQFPQTIDPATISEALAGKAGLREYLNYDQENVLGYQEYIPRLGAVYIHEHETKELFAPIDNLIRRIWMIALVVFILSGASAFYLIRRFLRPISSLTGTAEKIAEGNYRLRANVRTRDEIGVLADAFNKMTDSLVSSLNDASFKNALLQSQYDAALYGIISLSPKGEVLSWNKSFMDIWEIPDHLFQKRDAFSLIEHCSKKTKDPATFIQQTRESIKMSHAAEHETITLKNGKIYDQQSIPLHSQEGKVLGKIFFLRDITRETEVNQTKNEFVSIASHQLQTPLTAMSWLLENVLQMEKNNKDRDKGKYEILMDAYNSAQRMTRLVNDLLNVTRLDAGLISVAPKNLELVAFIKELAEKARNVASGKKIEVIFDGPHKPISIVTDKLLLETVVQNLISNAIRFSDSKKKITIGLKKTAKTVEIAIKDQGIGISKADQKRLFEKFFRTTMGARYNANGSGLGMYIIKKILELCKGEIRIESQENKGSVFTISLPLKISAQKKEGAKSLIQQGINKF